jgi:uncharacterized protein (DUF2345 family)
MYNSAYKSPTNTNFTMVTIGTVVSTTDPQQMGRLKIVCSKWGDTFDSLIDDLPWASYISPFGGEGSVGSRGPGFQESKGSVAYGFWAIPKIGAQVLVMCLDNDPSFRVYIGSMYGSLSPHTLPHGRFKYDGHPAASDTGSTPYGPYTSTESPIEPLATNYRHAFGPSTSNYEWQSRVGDYQAAAINLDHLDYTQSNSADDHEVTDPLSKWASTQGYGNTRYDETEQESKVVSLTSPGFHAISMDDRMENCRMRFRTTSGHQILLDDTNERIYIATAEGNNWIELDQDGNIDVYTSNKLNIRAAKDVNITSDETIRLQGKKGVHIVSGTDVRIQSTTDTHIKVGQNLRVGAGASAFIAAQQDIHALASSSLFLTSSSNLNLRSGGALNGTAGNTINMNASGDYVVTAATVHHNGPSAAVATSASPPSEQPAKWTNRVPTHEPFARTMTANDFTHEPEVPYFSDLVNRIERGRKIIRGLFWRR